MHQIQYRRTSPEGISLTLHVAGIRSLVAELTGETAADDMPEAAD
jgi:hypothetical protein